MLSPGLATATLPDSHNGNSTRRIRGQKTRRDCPVCQKSFSKTEHLLRHVRSHTKERPFSCAACGKSYSRNDSLKRHERGHSNSVVQDNECGPSQDLTSDDIQDEIVVGAGASVQGLATTAGPVRTGSSVNPPLDRTASSRTTIPLPQVNPPFDIPASSQTDTSMPQTQHTSPIFPLTTAPPADDVLWQSADYPSVAWLLSEDFDIGAVDLALNASISEWAQPAVTSSLIPALPPATATTQPVDVLVEPRPPALADMVPTPFSQETTMYPTRSDLLEDTMCREELVRLQWYTQLKPDDSHVPSRAVSPPPEGRFDVDERYRDKLSRQLSPRTYEAAYLSVDFLNVCLRLYFEKFNQVFRVIHMPTFRPTSSNSLLFLSMCSIGSLFVGSAEAAAQGHKIFSRLNKAILAAWESHLASTPMESLSMLQAALIGQTFGLLSGRPNDLVLVDSFQGTLLAWARKLGAFKSQEEPFTDQLDADSLGQAWHNWVFAEHLRRLAVALHVHDSEIAGLFHHDPLLRHATMLCTMPLNDAMFQAPNAAKWLQLYKKSLENRKQMDIVSLRTWKALNSINSIDLQIKDSDFGGYGVLSNIHALIVETRQETPFPNDMTSHLTRLLTTWYTSYKARDSAADADPYCLLALWHLCFASLYADLDTLEAALGREGSKGSKRSYEKVRVWASSNDALRCLVHVHLLQEQIESMRISATPPVHVPRALFCAGVAWICFGRFAPKPNTHSTQRNLGMAYPEIELVAPSSRGRNAAVEAFESINLSQHHSSATYGVIHLLKKLGRWGIADTFAGILKDAVSGIEC